MEAATTPFWVHCTACSSEWIAGHLPMDARAFTKALKAHSRCRCGSTKVAIGRIAHPTVVDPADSPMARIGAWLVGRDTGASSECIAAAFMGSPVHRGDHPLDPSDLGRCLRLMKLVPEIREGFVERMSAVSPTWKALAERWDEMASCMDAEVGIDWSKGDSAPRTYELICAIRKSVASAA